MNNKCNIVRIVPNSNRKNIKIDTPYHTTTRPRTFLAWYGRYIKSPNIIKLCKLTSTICKIKLPKCINVINKVVCAPGYIYIYFLLYIFVFSIVMAYNYVVCFLFCFFVSLFIFICM